MKENHVINHETCELPQFILQRYGQSLLQLSKRINTAEHLVILAQIFHDEIDPWKLCLNLFIWSLKEIPIRECQQDVNRDYEVSGKLNDLHRVVGN